MNGWIYERANGQVPAARRARPYKAVDDVVCSRIIRTHMALMRGLQSCNFGRTALEQSAALLCTTSYFVSVFRRDLTTQLTRLDPNVLIPALVVTHEAVPEIPRAPVTYPASCLRTLYGLTFCGVRLTANTSGKRAEMTLPKSERSRRKR